MNSRSWRGPESNRPQPHCKCSSPPWHMPPRERSRRGSNSPIAVDSRASSPEDFGTRGRASDAPVSAGCAEGIEPSLRDSQTRVRPSHCAHHVDVFREGLEPPSFAHQATALAAVLTEPGSKPGDRTLHVRRMKSASPPGELLAMLAGRRGVEPRWSDLETNPIPDRSLYHCNFGVTPDGLEPPS